MGHRRHRSVCDPMLEEDYLSDEGQSVKRLLDYLDILYTERQQRERIAECRAWLPTRLYKRVYDAVLKGWSLTKISKAFKRRKETICTAFDEIIVKIERENGNRTPPSSPNKVGGVIF